MRTSPQIGHSHLEQMNLIYEFICHFDVDRLLYAINGKRLDEDEIVRLTNEINDYHAKLKRQKEYLFKFCRRFPMVFASDDNRQVDSSVKVSWRMRSGTACAKKIFKRFCKVSQKQLPQWVPDHQAHEVSLISSPNYSLQLFGLSSYPLCVKELFAEMYGFYVDLTECLEEGLRTIKEVEATKKNAPKCLSILLEACEKSKKNQRVLIEAIMTDPDMKSAVIKNKAISGDAENPVLKEFKDAETNKEPFAQKYYKNCSPKDVDKITIYQFTKGEEDTNLAFAKVVFGDDEAKISRVNQIIEHFDELLPNPCKRNKIPALTLYFFYDWCQPNAGYESFLKYFNRNYKEHGGRWETIGKTAITGGRTKHTKCKDGSTQKHKEALLSQIAAMLNAQKS